MKDGKVILSDIISKDFDLEILLYKKWAQEDTTVQVVLFNDIKAIKYKDGTRSEFVHIYQNEEAEDQYSLLKPGTLIPIKAYTKIRAIDCNVGDKVKFIVARDVIVNNQTIIPYGWPVFGEVYEAKRSQWWGTKGRLGILFNQLDLPSGDKIKLVDGDLYVTGKNRTPLSVALSLFLLWPACFICGSGAEIPQGYEINTYSSLEGTKIVVE